MNSSRVWLEREIAGFATTLPQGSRILDAGAGDQPYRAMFAHCTYEAADFELVDKPYARSTHVCDLAAIPVEAGRFDAILFSQVMEHLPDPGTVLRELHRVLKPGGRLFCSAPLFYEEHEQPYDFHRYTQFGMRRYLEAAGFVVTDQRWLEGFAGTCAYQFDRMAAALPRHPRHYGGGPAGLLASLAVTTGRPLMRLAARGLNAADKRHRYTDAGYCKNWLMLAQRL
jgi:SAM-dependent methyltransferase